MIQEHCFPFYQLVHCLAIASSVQEVSWTLLELELLVEGKRVKKKRQPSHADCGEHTFLIQCFGPV